MSIRQKIKIGILTTATFLSVSNANAEDTGISWSLSLKGWANSWEEKISGETIKSDSSVLMIGPALNIKKDQFFGSISYTTSSSDYKFSFSSGETLTSKRNDLDIIGGFMLDPRYGVFIGYKSLTADLTYSYDDVGFFSTVRRSVSGTLTSKGPGIGITGNYPIENTAFVLYGSLGIMSLNSKIEFLNTSESNSVKGVVVDFGGSYIFTENLSATLGFKHQSFSGDEGKDIFSGLTLGAGYRF